MDATHHQLPLREDAKDDRNVLYEEEKKDATEPSDSDIDTPDECSVSAVSQSSTKSQICPHCQKNLYHKQRLTRHIKKVHRNVYPRNRGPAKLHAVPESFDTFVIHRAFTSKKFFKEDPPKLLISYTKDNVTTERVIVPYQEFKERFPRSMCRAFVQATILVNRKM